MLNNIKKVRHPKDADDRPDTKGQTPASMHSVSFSNQEGCAVSSEALS